MGQPVTGQAFETKAAEREMCVCFRDEGATFNPARLEGPSSSSSAAAAAAAAAQSHVLVLLNGFQLAAIQFSVNDL